MERSASKDDHRRPVDQVPLASHPLFTGTSMSDMCGVVEDHFTKINFQILANSPFPKRINAGPRGDVSLYFGAYGADVRLRPEVFEDIYAVGVMLNGRAWVTSDGERLVADAETGKIHGPGQQVCVRHSSDSTHLTVRVSRRAIDQAVRDYLGDEPAAPLRFAPGMDFSQPAARHWNQLVHLLAEEIECGALLNSPLAAQHFEQLLLHGLLYAQPHNLSGALPGRQHAASPHAVRRALRFCEEHAAEPISVAEIATAARTSIRTLQQLFREHVGTTPMDHMRQIRLDHAHADLRAIAQGQAFGSVADIAHRWGFAHLSRFATAYRRAYGQLPSQTLRDE